MSKDKRPRQQSEGRPLYQDERVLAWVAKRMQARSTRDELVEESRAGAYGWPVPGTYLTRVQVSQIQAMLWDRQAHGRTGLNGQAPHKVRSQHGNWNDKSNGARRRELKERKKAAPKDYLKLLDYQDLIVKLCAALEHFHPEGYDFGGEVGVWYASDLLDDLISLDTWLARAIPATQRWLSDAAVRKRIETLLNVEGRTPAETEAYKRRAAKLKRQLELVLT